MGFCFQKNLSNLDVVSTSTRHEAFPGLATPQGPQVISPYAPLPEPSPQAGFRNFASFLGLEERGTSLGSMGDPQNGSKWLVYVGVYWKIRYNPL